jgi:DivIVA domain-containing protein
VRRELDELRGMEHRLVRTPTSLAEVAALPTAKDIRSVRFSKSVRGCSPVAVNSFLLPVEARLEGRAALSAAEVRRQVFRKPSLSGCGYDQDEVNALKERIGCTLAELETP